MGDMEILRQETTKIFKINEEMAKKGKEASEAIGRGDITQALAEYMLDRVQEISELVPIYYMTPLFKINADINGELELTFNQDILDNIAIDKLDDLEKIKKHILIETEFFVHFIS